MQPIPPSALYVITRGGKSRKARLAKLKRISNFIAS